MNTPKALCACRSHDVSKGIRQDHVGRNWWRIHDRFECYEIHRDSNGVQRKKVLAKIELGRTGR